MFSCNEKTKKSKYIYLYINVKYKYIWETDGREVRLVEGRVGAGELIHWPLSLGWLSCCHSVPWWAFDLLLTPTHLLLAPYSGHTPPSLCPTLPLVGDFHHLPCQNTSMSNGHLKRRSHYKYIWKKELLSTVVLGTPPPPPKTLMPARLPALPLSQNMFSKPHTGKLPWQLPVTPNNHQRDSKLLGLKQVFILFLLFYFCSLLTICSFNGSHWDGSDKIIQSMAA